MRLFLLVFLFSIITSFRAQDSTSAPNERRGSLQLSFPLLDLPYNSYGSKTFENFPSTQNAKNKANIGRFYTFLSPEQSCQITNDVISAMHWSITKIPVFKRRKALRYATRVIIAAVGDAILLSSPYGAGWMHEEGHRAVMVNSYVFSYNPIIFKKRNEDASSANFQSVSYVLDTNLAMMKANDNANFVRLSTMGGEMQNYAMVKLQQRSFFQMAQGKGSSAQLLHGFYYMLNFINNTSYINICADSVGNLQSTLESMKTEGSKQYLRDFTGLDFAAWAYDLNRPTEAYAARGANPYGNGYDRYIYGNKLSDEEYKWLKKQTRLSLLNLVTPLIFNFQSRPIGADQSRGINFSLRHYPTSFGNQIGLDLFLGLRKFTGFFALHLNQNKQSTFPGFEALINEYEISKVKNISLTARLIVDMQPHQQLFTSKKADAVVLGSVQANFKTGKYFKPWIVVEAKNRGWIAGNAFLDKNVSARLGFSVYMGK